MGYAESSTISRSEDVRTFRSQDVLCVLRELCVPSSSRFMIRPILKYGDAVLHEKAQVVEAITPEIARLVDDMIHTMYAAPGVGLAAPQIGVPLRVAVIEVDEQLTVLVNPEVIKTEGEEELDEGCLSVPGYWGRITRAQLVVVKARDRFG